MTAGAGVRVDRGSARTIEIITRANSTTARAISVTRFGNRPRSVAGFVAFERERPV
jgi:hypothetical protein